MWYFGCCKVMNSKKHDLVKYKVTPWVLCSLKMFYNYHSQPRMEKNAGYTVLYTFPFIKQDLTNRPSNWFPAYSLHPSSWQDDPHRSLLPGGPESLLGLPYLKCRCSWDHLGLPARLLTLHTWRVRWSWSLPDFSGAGDSSTNKPCALHRFWGDLGNHDGLKDWMAHKHGWPSAKPQRVATLSWE